MKKLVADFEKNMNLKNARRLLDYIDRHPMCRAFIDTYEQTWIEIAQDMIYTDETMNDFNNPASYHHY